MPLSNGDNSDTIVTSSFVGRVEESNYNSNPKENSSIEAGFRGFRKVPSVLIPRINITPYLKTETFNNIDTDYQSHNFSGYNPLCDTITRKCSVYLVRNDLEKLRDLIIKDPSSECEKNTEMSTVNMKCKICDKVYNSEKKLQNHQENKHMLIYKPKKSKVQKRVSFSDKIIVHELKEYHKCRKCSKIFEDYKSLKLHMKQYHKKRKCYICNYCSKKFVDRMFFKVHMKLHCYMCGLLFTNKAEYTEHRRNVCRTLKHHKCKSCDSTFFKIMDCKDHSYDHTDVEYVCDICKDQCKTKCSMAHHLAFLHSKVRPTSLYAMRNLGTERLYLCNFCDTSSVERDVIEKHVELLPDLNNRAMTGYKDYYFCDHCYEKFDQETDLLQHKWTHFLKMNDNPQLRALLTKKTSVPKTYKIDEKLPGHIKQPKIILEKIKIEGEVLDETIPFVDVNNFDVHNGNIKKAVVDPKSKKTIFSKYQCERCNKYYSSRYCLNRHIETQHSDYESRQCRVCEETFVWPSLLKSHNCIRLNLPEMPFDDARPEIHFDNLHEITNNSLDDFNIEDSDDYMNTLDFEIPAPVVELTEYDGTYIPNMTNGTDTGEVVNDMLIGPRQNYYKIVMQEVPIEF